LDRNEVFSYRDQVDPKAEEILQRVKVHSQATTSANWGDAYTGLLGHRWGIISHNPYKVIRLWQGL